MTKRSGALLLALLTVGLVSLMGCGGDDSGKTTTVKASDGTLQCEIPAGWADASGKLNAVASLEVADEGADRYMVVIPELKDDFDADLDLEGYNKIIVNNVTKMVENAETVSTEELQINGNDAILTQIKGTVEGVKITYWLCAEEFPERYAQIMGWTLSGKAAKSEKTIMSVIRSVKEIAPDDQEKES